MEDIPVELLYNIVRGDIISSCMFVNKSLYSVCKYLISVNIEDIIKNNAHKLEVQLNNGKYCNFVDILLNRSQKEIVIATSVNLLHNYDKFAEPVYQSAMKKIKEFHCIYDVIGKYVMNSNDIMDKCLNLSSFIQVYLNKRYTILFNKRYDCTYRFATWLYFLLITPVIYVSYKFYTLMFNDRYEDIALYNPYISNKAIISATINDVIVGGLSGKFGFIILRMLRNSKIVSTRKLYKVCKKSNMLSNINYMLSNYDMKSKYKKKLIVLSRKLMK